MPKILRFKIRRLVLISALFFSTIGCDQVTKVVARDAFRVQSPLSFFGDVFRIQVAQNPGAFLNLGAGMHAQARFWVFTVGVALMLAACLALLLWRKSMDKILTIGLTLVVAGGVGNLIDRILYGSVTDFLNLGVGELRTGIFNIADMAVVAGVLVCVWRSGASRRRFEDGRSGNFFTL